MSEFYLVRHGQASFGAKNYDKLSALGHQQSRWLGEYFNQRNIHFDQVLLGDMVRHRETAEGICAVFEQSVDSSAHSGLNEFDFKNLAEVYLSLHPKDAPPPEAKPEDFYRLLKKAMFAWSADQLPVELLTESWAEFQSRVNQALQHICGVQQGSKVLVVSSGGAISMLMSQVLGFDAATLININMQVKNASFSHFYFNQSTARLSSFNNVPHLDHPDRPGSMTFS